MTDRTGTRRWLLHTAGTGLALGLAGCTGGDGGPQDTPSPAATQSASDSGTPTPPPTQTETATESSSASADSNDAAVEDEPGPPGYKNDHWHGPMFFEVDGELVDFDRSKYYLKNIEDGDPETVLFHFHESGHGPWEWSNEKQQITFERALNLLPGIGYSKRGGDHVVEYEGTTYDGGASGTEVTIHRGTEPIDPTAYTVQHGDAFWVQATSEDAKRNVEPAHGNAGLGTLIFDINNFRLDFSHQRFRDAGTDGFHFHDDGHPYLWYLESDGVTLADALNAIPGVTYSQDGAGHVIDYEGEEAYTWTYSQGNSMDEITIRQRTQDVDPPSYELSDGDVIWVYVHTKKAPDNEH